MAVETGGIFIVDAETGDTSQFTSITQSGSSSLTATVPAAIHGSFGFSATSDGTNFAYGSKTIAPQAVLFARFYLFVPTAWSQAADFNYTYILSLNSGATIRARVYIQQQPGGVYQLHGQLNSGSFSNFGTSNLTKNAVHMVELEFVANASTGGIQFWVDGISQGSIFTQNTGGFSITNVQLGAISQNAFPAGVSIALDDLKTAVSGPIGVYTLPPPSMIGDRIALGLQTGVTPREITIGDYN